MKNLFANQRNVEAVMRENPTEPPTETPIATSTRVPPEEPAEGSDEETAGSSAEVAIPTTTRAQ